MDNQFERLIDDTIQSLFTKRHKHILYGLVRWLRPIAIAEIGSFDGYCTAVMAKALQDNGGGHLFAVDNFSLGTSPDRLHNNLVQLEVANHVSIINTASGQLTELSSIDMAFIDGNHGYDGVTNDIELVIAAGAQCIVLHDSQSWWGVSKYMDDYFRNSTLKESVANYIEVPFDEGLTILMLKPKISPPKYTKEQFPKGYVE